MRPRLVGRFLFRCGHVSGMLLHYIWNTGDEVKEIIESRGGVFHPPDPDAAPGSYLHDPDGIRIQVGTKVGTKPY